MVVVVTTKVVVAVTVVAAAVVVTVVVTTVVLAEVGVFLLPWYQVVERSDASVTRTERSKRQVHGDGEIGIFTVGRVLSANDEAKRQARREGS